MSMKAGAGGSGEHTTRTILSLLFGEALSDATDASPVTCSCQNRPSTTLWSMYAHSARALFDGRSAVPSSPPESTCTLDSSPAAASASAAPAVSISTSPDSLSFSLRFSAFLLAMSSAFALFASSSCAYIFSTASCNVLIAPTYSSYCPLARSSIPSLYFPASSRSWHWCRTFTFVTRYTSSATFAKHASSGSGTPAARAFFTSSPMIHSWFSIESRQSCSAFGFSFPSAR
ncbi:hypothetical protein BV20DRAFT_172612 [Pilatotrama ljubarskyi]|nr:hypothetical protein BV20DRAFT_172612 [Pilatotrama ljubarskyi]